MIPSWPCPIVQGADWQGRVETYLIGSLRSRSKGRFAIAPKYQQAAAWPCPSRIQTGLRQAHATRPFLLDCVPLTVRLRPTASQRSRVPRSKVGGHT
jgi:hypothetical protein